MHTSTTTEVHTLSTILNIPDLITIKGPAESQFCVKQILDGSVYPKFPLSPYLQCTLDSSHVLVWSIKRIKPSIITVYSSSYNMRMSYSTRVFPTIQSDKAVYLKQGHRQAFVGSLNRLTYPKKMNLLELKSLDESNKETGPRTTSKAYNETDRMKSNFTSGLIIGIGFQTRRAIPLYTFKGRGFYK